MQGHAKSIVSGLVAVVLGVSLGVASTSRAEERLVISTGKERGSYFYIGQRLKAQYIMRYRELADVETSRGSLDNLRLLADPASKVGVALAQTDAVDLYLSQNPNVLDDLVVVGDIGRECAYLIVAADGPENIAGLKTGAGTISIDDPSSGADVTWRRLTQLSPAFGATRPVPVPTMEGLLQLDAGPRYSKLRAVLVVSRPRRASPPLKHVIGKPDRYRFLPIVASDVSAPAERAGRPVYTFERVSVGGKGNAQSVELDTLCTHGLVVASKKKLGYELRTRLSDLLAESGESILGTDE